MNNIIWGSSSNRKLSASELLAEHERLTEELEQVRNDIIKLYYRSYKLPAWAVNKQPDQRYTEKEFSEMLTKLKELGANE